MTHCTKEKLYTVRHNPIKKIVFRESRGFISTFYYFQEAAYFASILIGSKKAQY